MPVSTVEFMIQAVLLCATFAKSGSAMGEATLPALISSIT